MTGGGEIALATGRERRLKVGMRGSETYGARAGRGSFAFRAGFDGRAGGGGGGEGLCGEREGASRDDGSKRGQHGGVRSI